MQSMEIAFKRRLRNITIFVEYDDITDLDEILRTIESENATIYDLDTEHAGGRHPSAIMTLKLDRKNASHSSLLSSVAELPCVHSIQELIA